MPAYAVIKLSKVGSSAFTATVCPQLCTEDVNHAFSTGLRGPGTSHGFGVHWANLKKKDYINSNNKVSMSNLTPALLKMTMVFWTPKSWFVPEPCSAVEKAWLTSPVQSWVQTVVVKALQPKFVLSSVPRMSIMPFRQACRAPAQVMVLVSTEQTWKNL